MNGDSRADVPVVRHHDHALEAQGRADAAVADGLRTPEELQGGMYHERAGVRRRVVDRLIARGADHPNTIPTLVDVLKNDPDPVPRFMVAMDLYQLDPDPRIVDALLDSMRNDSDIDVRDNAMFSLDHLGLLDSALRNPGRSR
ncbi:MAG: HEAT repeat domain-containing protein [Pseudolysinimonas sp.]